MRMPRTDRTREMRMLKTDWTCVICMPEQTGHMNCACPEQMSGLFWACAFRICPKKDFVMTWLKFQSAVCISTGSNEKCFQAFSEMRDCIYGSASHLIIKAVIYINILSQFCLEFPNITASPTVIILPNKSHMKWNLAESPLLAYEHSQEPTNPFIRITWSEYFLFTLFICMSVYPQMWCSGVKSLETDRQASEGSNWLKSLVLHIYIQVQLSGPGIFWSDCLQSSLSIHAKIFLRL